MESTAFTLDLGIDYLRGIIRLEAAGIVVEWRRFNMLDAPVGELDSILIPYTEIDSVSFKKRFVGSTLAIRVKRPAALGALPLPGGEITLLKASVPRAHRGGAALLVAEAELRAIESEEGPTAIQE